MEMVQLTKENHTKILFAEIMMFSQAIMSGGFSEITKEAAKTLALIASELYFIEQGEMDTEISAAKDGPIRKKLIEHGKLIVEHQDTSFIVIKCDKEIEKAKNIIETFTWRHHVIVGMFASLLFYDLTGAVPSEDKTKREEYSFMFAYRIRQIISLFTYPGSVHIPREKYDQLMNEIKELNEYKDFRESKGAEEAIKAVKEVFGEENVKNVKVIKFKASDEDTLKKSLENLKKEMEKKN
jgi:hypothetical protein